MNRLGGTFPTRIGEMKRLTRLDVSYNAISGSSPTKLGRLRKLRTLVVLGTTLSGEVPLEICSLGALTTFLGDFCKGGDLLACTVVDLSFSM